jgi:hypothetical protein
LFTEKKSIDNQFCSAVLNLEKKMGEPWDKCVIGGDVKKSVINIAKTIGVSEVTSEEVIIALEKAVKGYRDGLRSKLVDKIKESGNLALEVFETKHKLMYAENENVRLTRLVLDGNSIQQREMIAPEVCMYISMAN